MVKILVINVMALYSYGGRAVIRGFIEAINTALPDAEITFMVSHYKKEAPTYSKWGFKNVCVIDHLWYRETNNAITSVCLSGINGVVAFSSMLMFKFLSPFGLGKSPYDDFDVIVDLTTDGPNDHYRLSMTLFSLFNTYLATLSNKPIVISAASIGTFKKRITKMLARYVLNRVDVIEVREERTLEYLDSLNISHPNIYLTADLAFLMDPASKERINSIFSVEGLQDVKKPIFGVTPSYILHKYAFPEISSLEKKEEEYNNIIIKTINYLTEKYDCTVLLIPHAAAPNFATKNDDQTLSREIYEKVKENVNIKLIHGDYDADELKGIISRCDLFIGCRMHATIAATSTHVPTVALVYGHKSHGILGKMLGLEANIIAVEDYDPPELYSKLISKIDFAWQNRDQIRDQLEEKIESTQHQALLNGDIISGIIEKH